jgi:hypothetical protein
MSWLDLLRIEIRELHTARAATELRLSGRPLIRHQRHEDQTQPLEDHDVNLRRPIAAVAAGLAAAVCGWPPDQIRTVVLKSSLLSVVLDHTLALLYGGSR